MRIDKATRAKRDQQAAGMFELYGNLMVQHHMEQFSSSSIAAGVDAETIVATVEEGLRDGTLRGGEDAFTVLVALASGDPGFIDKRIAAEIPVPSAKAVQPPQKKTPEEDAS